MTRRHGIYVTALENGCIVYEFKQQDTSSAIQEKPKRKSRDAENRQQMLANMVQHMLDYVKGELIHVPQAQQCSRLHIGIRDLLN